MKAWSELKERPHVSFVQTDNSEFYVNHGVKIERFNDGRIEVKNTMTNSDHYEDVPWEILQIFKEVGFAVCSYVHKNRADKVMYNIELALRDDRTELAARLNDTYLKVFNKHLDYEDRISKLSSSL
jgi:hypothetical protein